MSPDTLTVSTMIVWAVGATQLLNLILMVWNILASGSRANAKTLENHGESLRTLDSRLNKVEHSLRELPSRHDFHGLDKQMTQLSGSIEVLMERLRPVEAISERLQATLIDRQK